MNSPSITRITADAADLTRRPTAIPAPRCGRDTEFARVLSERLQTRSISLSMHAADRLVRRGLVIDQQTVEQINEAFDLAEKKGSRNALFLLDELAVVASVTNRSILTALDAKGLSNGVFTQIDSAVVLHRNDTLPENNQLTDNQGQSRTSAEEAFAGTGVSQP